MKKILVRLAIFFLATTALSGCIWHDRWEDDHGRDHHGDYGEHHEGDGDHGEHHDGDHGERHY